MSFPRVTSSSSKYAPLPIHDDGEDSNSSLEMHSSTADDGPRPIVSPGLCGASELAKRPAEIARV
jgi:hypothetical protein